MIALHAAVPASVVDGWTLRLVGRASFSYLRYTWTEDLAVPADRALVVRVAPPPDARLHALASDYVTDLAVRVEARDAGGLLAFELVAPPVFVAWPDGPTGAPVVWDAATAAVLAPRGVVSADVRATLSDSADAVGRILPPVSRPGAPLGDETESDPDRATLGLAAVEED